MPDYKERRIELTPKRQADGIWHCPYTIIEFRQTCWAYHKGCSNGDFSSRHEAATAALEEAKRIVDSLEPSAPGSLLGSRMVRGMSGSRMRRLTVSFIQRFVFIGNMVRRSASFLPTYRKI